VDRGHPAELVHSDRLITRQNQPERNRNGEELWDKGIVVRKEVLGAEYVERNVKAAGRFSVCRCRSTPTERAGLAVDAAAVPAARRRSLINLAMLSALNRPHEFKVHVKAR